MSEHAINVGDIIEWRSWLSDMSPRGVIMDIYTDEIHDVIYNAAVLGDNGTFMIKLYIHDFDFNGGPVRIIG